jgi:hypothetical protein
MPSVISFRSVPRDFIVAGAVTAIILGLVLYYLGSQAAITAIILMIIEVTFSFDNAIVNARTLTEMNVFWQRMFMTVGIVIAVVGMRILFPIVIVMVSAGLAWGQVIHLVLQEPSVYATTLQHAQPSIMTFGGMFLLTLALSFFFDASRNVHWLHQIEKPLQAASRKGLHLVVSGLVLAFIAVLPSNPHHIETLVAGGVGIIAYAAMHGLSSLFMFQHENAEKRAGKRSKRAAMAGFAAFVYLEVLDASFSFDGVIGAFAVTKNVVLIAVGLGVGALWVRALTLFIVHRKLLRTYRYLEHAAHYVIGSLAIALLIGLFYDIPDLYVGGIGLVLIAAAVMSSIKDNRKDERKLF